MGTIDDIGVPGQPMNNPPLTEWQAAVRDALHALKRTARGEVVWGGLPWQFIAFPAGMFTAPPILSIAIERTGAEEVIVTPTIRGVTATSFQITLFDPKTGAVANVPCSIHWTAAAAT